MFVPYEIEALIVGACMVEAWAGRGLAEAEAGALIKVVPSERIRRRTGTDLCDWLWRR